MNRLLIVSIILLCLCIVCARRKTYNLEFLYINCSTTDEKLANISVRLETGMFGVSKLSGAIDWQFDDDENTMTEMSIYTCHSGREMDYHLIPYEIPKTPFYEFINQYYMSLFYPDFGPCSNLPAIKPPFVPPWEKKIYIFNNCLPTGETYPEFLPPGYYKFVFAIIGQVKIGVTLIVKLNPAFL